MRGLLIVFSGLPGTGKSTLARKLAMARNGTYLRIDSIEQALRSSGALAAAVGPAGYLVAYALAAGNLDIGATVVADCVNPVDVTRRAWRATAARSGAMLFDLEVVCSDPAEHRRRVEMRLHDSEGLSLPSWADVVNRQYEPWETPLLRVDTALLGTNEAVAAIQDALAAQGLS